MEGGIVAAHVLPSPFLLTKQWEQTMEGDIVAAHIIPSSFLLIKSPRLKYI